MKKFLVCTSMVLFSLLSFVSCTKDGDPISLEDSFKGYWQYTCKYVVINNNRLDSTVNNGAYYAFEDNNQMYVMQDSTVISGVYAAENGIITYTDENSEFKSKSFRIQGDKLYIYETLTNSAGGTYEKGIILTRKNSVPITMMAYIVAASSGSSTSGGSSDPAQLIATWNDIKDYAIASGVKEETDPTSPYTITFKADGTEVSTGTDSPTPAAGSYVVSGNKITITNSADSTDITICYYKFESGNLNLYQQISVEGVDITSGSIMQKQ